MIRLLVSSVFMAMIATAAAAQTAPVTEDEIIVEGQRRGADAAMDAFLSGDYLRAEAEFERNYARLRRGDFLRRAAIDQGARDALSGLVAQGPGEVGGTNGATARATDSNLQGGSLNFTPRRLNPDDPEAISSGTDLGFQLYMAGLSEIQLRKYAEARKSLDRALELNPDLYDARLKLGLLDWQAGNRDGAVRQLARLERDLERCIGRCAKDRDLIEAALTPLRDALRKG